MKLEFLQNKLNKKAIQRDRVICYLTRRCTTSSVTYRQEKLLQPEAIANSILINDLNTDSMSGIRKYEFVNTSIDRRHSKIGRTKQTQG